jgi:hypothetical protein
MNPRITVQPFAPQYTEAVVAMILSIQIGEFQVPISRQDQPDLDKIPAFYQQGKGNFWIALHEGEVVGTIAAVNRRDTRTVRPVARLTFSYSIL